MVPFTIFSDRKSAFPTNEFSSRDSFPARALSAFTRYIKLLTERRVWGEIPGEFAVEGTAVEGLYFSIGGKRPRYTGCHI